MLNEIRESIVNELKEIYPEGQRVLIKVLHSFPAPPPGTVANVVSVDDFGNIKIQIYTKEIFNVEFGLDEIRPLTPEEEKELFKQELMKGNMSRMKGRRY